MRTAGFGVRPNQRVCLYLKSVGFRISIVATLVLAAAFGLGAAAGPSVRGRVTDPAGLPLPGVAVTLVPVAGGPALLAVTDAQGTFAADAPAGRYRLRAEISGFEPAEQSLTVLPGAPLNLSIGLRLAAFEQQITVHEDAPQPVLGVPRPDAPVTATREVVDSGMLPNSQYDDVLPLLPNVVRGPDGLISVAGASAPQGGLLVNGVNLADPISGEAVLLLPLKAIESVDVFSGGYAADAGRATGGVTSVHTRSGGDRWHASANSFFPRLRFVGGAVHGVDSWEPNVGASGPIVRGRLFVEGAVSYRYDRNRYETLSGPQDSVYAALMAWGQVDAALSPSHHVAAWLSFDPQRIDRAGITAFTPAASVPRLNRGGWSAGIGDRVTIGDRSVVELRAGVVRNRSTVTPDGSAPYEVGHDGTTGSYFDARDLRGTRTEAAAGWSWTAPRGHQVSAGASLARAAIEGTEAAGRLDLLRSDGTPGWAIIFQPLPAPIAASAFEAGLFVQDRWTISPRITVDAGVRYDRSSSARAVLSPRVAWTVTLPPGDTTLGGSVGIYADKIPLEALVFSAGQPRLVQEWDALGGQRSSRLFTNAASGDWRTPTATRWDVGIDHRFARGWQARIRYQERRGSNELVVEPVVLSPTAGWLELRAEGESRARSVETTFAYRATGAGAEWYVSYVRSATRGNVNTLESIQGAFRNPFVQPDQAAPLRADVPNRLLAWGQVHLPLRITVAPYLELRDGFPYSLIDDTWTYAGPAGSGRLPWFGSFDLYVNKVFTISPRLPDARIGLKLYNVASLHTERDIQRDVARPDFGRAYNPIPRDFTLVFELLWGRK